MSCRRSLLLEMICSDHLTEHGGDPDYASRRLPLHKHRKTLVHSSVDKVGLPWWFFFDGWPTVFKHYLDGGLRRSREATMAWLPEENVAAIMKDAKKIGYTYTNPE